MIVSQLYHSEAVLKLFWSQGQKTKNFNLIVLVTEEVLGDMGNMIENPNNYKSQLYHPDMISKRPKRAAMWAPTPKKA